MIRRSLLGLLGAAVLAASLAPPALAQDAERRRGFAIQITSPASQDIVLGKTRIAAKVRIDRPEDVDRVEFLVNDAVVFVDREPPYECFHDFGETPRSFVIRAVAYHKEGITVSDAVVTRKIEVAYFEQVNRVILWASVTDRKDQFVSGLGRDDFRVIEDGNEQTVQEFTAEDRPIALAILLDTSGSMKERMKQVHAAAGAFVDTLRPEDRALVIAFDDKVFLLQDLTADRDALKDAITSTEAIGATAIYDALHAAFRKLRGIPGRKAIILLSDGDDTSSQAGYARVLEEAKAQNVLIYGIGLGIGMLDRGRKNVLKEFSDVTGGRAYFVKEAKDLAGAYQQIADELRHEYYLTYSTSNTTWDGRWIKVEVEARNSDYSVRARRGFFAVRAAAAGSTP
ncbi:MAG: VWA domain-containing protein [Acidobacteriia bacterium]|nr:VWA domain-containing protein [Terriglobia bacterium]